MKIRLFLFSALLCAALALGVLVSCKDQADPAAPFTVYGVWTWTKSVGGIAGVTLTPQGTRHSLTWIFEKQGFAAYQDTTSEIRGTFTVEDVIVPTPINGTQNYKSLTIFPVPFAGHPNADTLHYLFTVSGNSISVSEENVADGFTMTFFRFGED